MAIWLFLFLITLPSFCIRSTILHRKLTLRSALFVSYFTGACQDIFISFQQFFFLILLKTLFSFGVSYLFWIFIIGSSLVILHMIFDAFLHCKVAIRMEISFFSFIDDLRCFWDSAKEKKVWRFIPAALLFLLVPIFTYWYCWSDLMVFSIDIYWIALGIMFGIIGFIGTCFLPKKMVYATDNVVFQHEVWYLKKLYRFLKRKNDRTDLGYLKRAIVKEENEKKTYPSSEYPLIKYTHGFSGEKQFEINLKEKEYPHVVFLFLESFRAKNVGCLGSEKGVTPHFDQLSKEGILFSNFYANSIRTSRSVVSSLFGLPSDVDASEAAAQSRIPFIGIPQLMQKAGYQTSYLHNGPIEFENQDVFFDLHSYDKILGMNDIEKSFPKMHATSWGLPDECLMHYAANFLEKYKNTPQFLTLFTITNHHPWNLPKHRQSRSFFSEVSHTYQKYLNTFHYTDECLGLLIKLLKEKGLSKNTLFFILGDHGYPMGEHGNFMEQRYLYEENIHIPLLIYGDGRIPNPQIITDIASQVDLVPTVMDLLNLQGLNLSIGSSLVRKNVGRQVYFHNPYVFKNYGCRVGKYKFIYTHISQELELYDLENDPYEKKNIARDNLKLAQEFLYSVKSYEQLFFRLYAEKQLVPNELHKILNNSYQMAF